MNINPILFLGVGISYHSHRKNATEKRAPLEPSGCLCYDKNYGRTTDRRIIIELSLQFLIGPPKEMLNALSQCNYAELDRLTERKADFSLHLQPRDLQILSDCAASHTSQSLRPFRAALTCYLDEADRGYFLVHNDWVDAMATVDINKYKVIAAEWFEKMAENYPNEQIGEPSAAAEKAVHSLIELCRYALQFEKPVIHIWAV